MDNKNKCEIIRDLAIPYKENLINQGSKDFIEEHLLTCDDCKKYYKNITSDIFDNNLSEKNKDNIVINEFKKVHRHINILKMSLIIVLISIFIIVSAFFLRFQRIRKVIDTAYNKVQYMRNLDNYKLTVKTIQKNLKTDNCIEYEQNYYYKDGKYKIESDDSIKFYEDDSYKKICVYHDLNTIEYYEQDFVEEHKGRLIGIFSEVINYKELTSSLSGFALSIREERYNGIDCYVIRFGNSNSYRDTWIDKNSSITVRVVNEEYMDFYREEIYTFHENIVNDDDVDTTVLNSDKYENYTKKNIQNNATKETKLYYELYNK